MSKAPPTRLHFDDGSRIITENIASTIGLSTNNTNDKNNSSSTETELIVSSPRDTNTPINTYYEIERIASEIVDQIVTPDNNSPEEQHDDSNIEFLIKVALQFPDELLDDAAEVSWLIEESIANTYSTRKNGKNSKLELQPMPLVFVLGDTTYSSCCPDEIGALHLNADVIVHYGQYACLGPSESLPVIYSFGVQEWVGMEECVNAVSLQINESYKNNNKEDDDKIKLLLLSERRCYQYMEQLSSELMKHDDSILEEVLVGVIPVHDNRLFHKSRRLPPKLSSCCSKSNGADNIECCKNDDVKGSCDQEIDDCAEGRCSRTSSSKTDSSQAHKSTLTFNDDNGCYIGGLFVPIHPSKLSRYTLLYIGDDSGQSKSRQFLNTILKCTSSNHVVQSCWSYNPSTKQLSTDPYSILGVSRFLNRRFYLTQKAQVSNIMGILVGTLSQHRFQNVISTVRNKIENSGRAYYTFVVGKINVAKLANFAEVECFVLISCGETSILQDERDFHVPVITPSELDVALGESTWDGSASCNTDFDDFLKDSANDNVVLDQQKNNDQDHDNDQNVDEGDEEEDDSNDDDDKPFFSMISGTYVSKARLRQKESKVDKREGNEKMLEDQLGNGQMIEYRSEAAEFWKKREYKGLDAQIGKNEVNAAVEGQTGIASDYGK